MATCGSTTKQEKAKYGSNGTRIPTLYFSGTRRFSGHVEADLIRLIGWKNRCFSFAYLDRNLPTFSSEHYACWEASKDAGLHWFLDSGAFTFQKRSVTPEELEDILDKYAKFAKRARTDWYVNFDYVKQASLILKMQRALEKRGIEPVPVYHGDDTLNYLRGYLDAGYERIAIGKPPGNTSMYVQEKLYQNCFKVADGYKVKFHGFGVTGTRIFHFPWDSVDSTSWLKAAIRGCIILLNGKRGMMNVVHIGTERENGLWRNHIGHMNGAAQEEVRDRAKRYGITWKQLQSSIMWRSIFNAKSYIDGMVEVQKVEGHYKWESLL